jgi:protease-4
MYDDDRPSRRGCFTRLWNGLDLTRRITANLLFLLLLVFLIYVLFSSDLPRVPAKTALVLAPEGEIVEQLAGDPADRALAELLGDGPEQTLLRDLLTAIGQAKDDDRVQALVLELGQVGGVGLSQLQDLQEAIRDFKTSGKKVVARADNFTQHSYYLASLADEVHLHDMGMVLLQGYGVFRSFFKEGLDRLEVDVHVFRVGEYKSAVEPFLRNDMSPEAREANLAWLGDLWSAYKTDVAAARELSPEAVEAYVVGFKDLLAAHQGDTARAALEAGLVDHLGSHEDFNDRLVELLGEDEETGRYPQIDHESYLKATAKAPSLGKKDKIAVIVAQGEILDGSHPPGTVGGDSTAELIRDARRDPQVKALVLRVDSPGGSAFASEIIRQQLSAARAEELPVVVSMGSVAASGGYWISTASDEIWAAPTTITGSIGIFGLVPTFQKPLAKYLGTRVDGVGTTPLSGAFRLDRELAPEAAEAIQLVIERGYQDFLERVAEARDMEPEAVDPIARGRVWSGLAAHRLGLVDQLGDLDEAIASAAKLAEVEDYEVWYPEPELEWFDQLLLDLAARAVRWTGGDRRTSSSRPLLHRLGEALEGPARLLARWNDPQHAYAYCFCEVR